MFKILRYTFTSAGILAVIATQNMAIADIVYANGNLLPNRGYLQRWAAAGGTTPGVVSCGATTCAVGLAYQWYSQGHPGYYWHFVGDWVIVNSGTLWNDAVRQWINKFGRSGSDTSYWDPRGSTLTSTCMRASQPYDLAEGQIPVRAACNSILPAPAKCDFSTQAITLNHNTIDKNAVNGHTATTQFNVSCTSPVTVKVDNVQGNGPTQVLPGITSTVQIDGRALGSQLQWQTGTTTHTATSRLTDTGTSLGDFNAYIVLRLTIL
ncbi:hypothetical protein NTD86_19475 [Pseudomonas sp. 7P_10.2_Bac1]|uniref:MrpH family fimbial adhesin n=1 Tax=Pseudomonas sp. 7P_10.2_Bac1 TaxID=2971614 RepID=UPI0021C63411|nr:hypothetical protein [Pseudomonas sp. 7P_10.2_Bac1]MCU1729159.1 hypothetical protein [Pseudomonas sp. 7P_10.2_Bac1]